jgi:hypothetical protein
MTLTDPQARRERIAELRGWASDPSPTTPSKGLAEELADALEWIDQIEFERSGVVELSVRLSDRIGVLREEALRAALAEVDRLERYLRHTWDTAQWNAEANGSHEDRTAWGALASA